MLHKKPKPIYYINRYDLFKTVNVRKHSGYEQIVEFDNNFKRVKSNKLLSKLIFIALKKETPKHYIKLSLGKEMIVLFKALITGYPIFYLYADKDAFLLPLLKKRFKLNRLKVYGTLHWPLGISQEFSFFENNLARSFDGIIGLSSSITSLEHDKIKIIPHGIDLGFWTHNDKLKKQNLYLIIGVSNRNHSKQIDIVKKIKKIDSHARFLLISRSKDIQRLYSNIESMGIVENYVEDDALRLLFNKARAIILFQDYCLASNVVLESIAMGVPLIANRVGDIEEYLGVDYPLYINSTSEKDLLKKVCFSERFRIDTINYLLKMRSKFDWSSIAKKTIDFIN